MKRIKNTLYKKILIFIVVIFVFVLKVGAQEFSAPTKTKIDSTTTYTYKIDTTIYKVYKSSKGAYYIWKKSKKTNKPYKYYIPKEIQIKMGRKYDN